MTHETRTVPLDAGPEAPPPAPDAAALASLGIGAWHADAGMTRLESVSPVLERLLGFPASRWRDEAGLWLSRVHPLDREGALRARAGDGERVHDYRMLAADGRTLWLRESLRVAQGRVSSVVVDVTRSKEAEAAIRVSDERFQLVARATNDTIWDWDLATNSLWWNENFSTMFGYGLDEIESSLDSWTSRIHPEDLDRVKQGILAAIAGTASTWQDEYRFRRKDGSHALILDRGFIIRDGAGKGVRMVGSMMDITESREREASLRESEERFRRAFSDASIGMVMTDPAGRIVLSNAAFSRMLGYEQGQVEGKDFAALTHPEDIAKSREMVQRLLGGETSISFEKRYLHREGKEVWTHVTSSLVRGVDGAPRFFLTQILGVTERKRAEAELERTRHNLELILHSAGEGIYGVDATGVTTFINDAGLKMLGLTREEAVGVRLHPVIHHTHADGSPHPAPECPIYVAAHGGPSATVKDDVFWTKAGKPVPVEYVTAPIHEGDQVVGAVTVFKDVTELRRSERELQRVKHNLELILNSAGEGVYGVDATGVTTFINDAGLKMLGITREEAIGVRLHPIIHHTHPDGRPYPAPECPIYQAAHGGPAQTVKGEFFYRKDGAPILVDYVTAPIQDEGRVLGAVTVFQNVTERRQAEDALRESEARYRFLAENSRDMITRSDPQGRLRYVSPASLRLLGYAPEELLGRRSMDLVHPEDAERVARERERLAASADAGVVTLRFRRKDGEYVWLEAIGQAVTDPATGALVEMVATSRDVTDRRRTEEALRRSNERTSAILETISDAFFALDRDWRFTYVNRQAEILLGRTQEDLVGKAIWVEFADAVGTPFEHHYRRAIETQTPTQFEAWYEGLQNWYDVRAYPGPEGLSVYFQTITERKRAEQEIREARERLDIALTAGALGAWDLDLEKDSAIRSPRHDQIFGYPDGAGEWGAARFLGHIVPEDRPGVQAAFAEAMRTGRLTFECRIVRADGPLAWITASGLVVERDGKPVRMLGVVADITERKQVEDALKARARDLQELATELQYQRDLTRTMTDNAGSALFMMDTSGLPIFVNPAGLEMTGYASLEEMQGRPLHESVHFRKPDGSSYPIEECPIDNANAEVRPLKDQREVFCRKDGSLFPVQYNVAPIVKDGQRMGAVIEVRDVTEQERAEEALRQRAEELTRLTEALTRSNRELDQFAYITSHDLKAPLRGIANLSRWIEEDAQDRLGPESRQHLELMRGRVNRMEALIDAILEYSRVGRVRGRQEDVEVGALLSDVVDLLAPPPGVRVEVAQPMPVVPAERMRLHQVFANLIGNAVKHHHDKEHALIRITAADDGAHWRFSVADNGPGIAPRFHEKVFVIFQTLEARDRVEGTGIGLALVKKIIESNGGTITLDSDAGRGATFTFTWPKRRENA